MTARANLRVYRARFSAITPRDITRSLRNLGPINDRVVAAVDTRTEIDLRLGAVFTRFQSGALVCALRLSGSLALGALAFLNLGL
jgi:DNA topoisomerase IA